MDAVAHGRVALSGVLGGSRSLGNLHYLADHLTSEHFTDKVQRVLFQTLVKYDERNGGVMTRAALGDLLAGRPPGEALMYEEAYDLLAGSCPEAHEFSHSVGQLRDLAAERATGDALAVGMAILKPRPNEEVRDERTGAVLSGHADARAYVLAEFAEAETAAGATDSPGGDVMTSGDDILAAYAKVKEARAAGITPGIEFGIPALDRHLDGGLGTGELGLVAAPMTAGKSSFCAQAAWHNAVNQGRNVIIFTTEQNYVTVRTKVVARHSRHPKFGLPRGLDSRLIRSGRLDAEGERALAAVVDDLKHGGYGSLQTIQMPALCTLPVLSARAEAVARTVVPDVIYIDYLQLFETVRKTRDFRMNESQGDILRGAQRLGQSFRRGRGVSVVSPWQVNKEGMNSMKGGGEYRLEDLSETVWAGRHAGMVLGLMTGAEDNTGGRAAQVTLKVLKFRDGPKGWKFPLTVDFATCYFGDREDAMAGEDDYLDLGGI